MIICLSLFLSPLCPHYQETKHTPWLLSFPSNDLSGLDNSLNTSQSWYWSYIFFYWKFFFLFFNSLKNGLSKCLPRKVLSFPLPLRSHCFITIWYDHLIADKICAYKKGIYSWAWNLFFSFYIEHQRQITLPKREFLFTHYSKHIHLLNKFSHILTRKC